MKEIILIKPSGFCAGVRRAINTLDLAIKRYATPIYAYHEIVHNSFVVDDFKNRGVIFIEDIDAVPNGSVLAISAHGVSPKIIEEAKDKQLTLVDATCPLVTKTHIEARKFYNDGCKIILIGKKGHQEVKGIMGEVPMTLISGIEDINSIKINEDENVACLTQTTLSLDETRDIIETLKEKFNHLKLPPKENICYATQNRQCAIKEVAPDVDIIVVIGSINSSNSNKLREIASQYTRAILTDNEAKITVGLFRDVSRIGITAGASAPIELIEKIVNRIKIVNNVAKVKEREYTKEGMEFALPI